MPEFNVRDVVVTTCRARDGYGRFLGGYEATAECILQKLNETPWCGQDHFIDLLQTFVEEEEEAARRAWQEAEAWSYVA